jgi:hypothetical protein
MRVRLRASAGGSHSSVPTSTTVSSSTWFVQTVVGRVGGGQRWRPVDPGQPAQWSRHHVMGEHRRTQQPRQHDLVPRTVDDAHDRFGHLGRRQGPQQPAEARPERVGPGVVVPVAAGDRREHGVAAVHAGPVEVLAQGLVEPAQGPARAGVRGGRRPRHVRGRRADVDDHPARCASIGRRNA